MSAKRQALIDYIWGTDGFPSHKLPTQVEQNDLSPVAGLTNAARVDTLTIGMEAGQTSYAHHFLAQRPNNRLVVLHHGHLCTFDDGGGPPDAGPGMQRTINALLGDGYSVLAVYMPRMVRFTTRVAADDCAAVTHDEMLQTIPVATGSPLKFFLEPVAVALNYVKTQAIADGFPAYTDFAMVGLSGGGWTTTVYAALDPTITTSVPVAGTLPLYLRWPYTVGDLEQTLPAFYQLAGYPDLYVLGSYGPGRAQVHVLNRRDNCCFGEAQHSVQETGASYDDAVRSFERDVRFALYALGAGAFRLEIDESAPDHQISWNTIVHQILAELNGDRRYVGAASASDAFVRGLNGDLWHYGEHGWDDTGFPMVGVPAVVENAAHRFDVFFRSPANRLTHAYPSGAGWTAVDIDGIVITDPTAVSAGPGQFDVVALGRSARPFHWSWNGVGVNRELMSAQDRAMGAGPLSLVSRGGNELHAFTRGRTDGALIHLRSDGAGAWTVTDLGGSMRGFPSAAAATDGSLRAYVRGHSGQIWEASSPMPGSWMWASVSAAAGIGAVQFRGSPGASLEPDGSVAVYLTTPGGTLGELRGGSTWSFTDRGGSVTGSPIAVPGGAHVRSAGGSLWLNVDFTWIPRQGLFY